MFREEFCEHNGALNVHQKVQAEQGIIRNRIYLLYRPTLLRIFAT